MRKEKIEMDLSAFPPALHPLLRSGTFYDSSCHSTARVLYCDTGYYIKMDENGELAREAELTRHFHSLGLGVEVMAYLSEDRDYLVTRSARGQDLTHWQDDPERLCRIYAQALRRLHDTPVGNVSKAAGFQHYQDTAAGDFPEGIWEDFVLMDRFPIRSREEAWAIMQENKDRLRADTLIHGDACLPNLLLEDWEFSAFIDCGLAGRGDKHIDLYWAIWSLAYNLKTDRYTDYFLDQYGRDRFDPRMLRVVAAFELFG